MFWILARCYLALAMPTTRNWSFRIRTIKSRATHCLIRSGRNIPLWRVVRGLARFVYSSLFLEIIFCFPLSLDPFDPFHWMQWLLKSFRSSLALVSFLPFGLTPFHNRQRSILAQSNSIQFLFPFSLINFLASGCLFCLIQLKPVLAKLTWRN